MVFWYGFGYGKVEGRVWVAAYTTRGQKHRFISVRKANAREAKNTRRAREPDPDAPLTDDEFERGYGAMLARKARSKTGLTQQAFADRYGIPVASVRDWEQGRRARTQPRCELRRVGLQAISAGRLRNGSSCQCAHELHSIRSMLHGPYPVRDCYCLGTPSDTSNPWRTATSRTRGSFSTFSYIHS